MLSTNRLLVDLGEARRWLNLPILLLISAALTAILFALSSALPPLVPCADPMAQSLGLALCAVLGLSLLAGVRLLGRHFRWVLSVEVVLILLVAWLGVYPISPLFSSGRIPVLQGFSVMTRVRGTVNVAPGAVVTLGSGTPAAIQALMMLEDVRCTWMSTFGGALDDPYSCITAYVPPQREYDILKVSLQPGCGLPRSVEQIKVSILP